MKFIQLETGGIVYALGRVESVPEDMNSQHCHDTYEILYITEGSGVCTVEGVDYPIKPRTLMIFPPLSFHCASLDAGVAYERHVINFEKRAVSDCAMEAFSSLIERSVSGCLFYSADSISNAVTAVFDRFEVAEQLPGAEGEAFAQLLLSELVLLLSVAKYENWYYDEGELGARVIKYINENIERELPLDKLAKRFFVSKYYLCRMFKKYSGISIHGYITKKRIMYAKQLIEAGENATVAAYRVGFCDYSAFYRAYVKLVGHAPSATDERRNDEI